ncbi:MAG TPA: hypothetical protein VF665_15680 [Longimicrobium sp.]|jgi:hypothetical protein|uniref:hypothetical protein n=1 Tax=Longimicrobium sp. TaxID=2029185 RepID=UPI002EDB6BF1
MTVSTAFLIQRILSPNGPSGFAPVVPAPTSFGIADIINPRGASAPAQVRVLKLAA